MSELTKMSDIADQVKTYWGPIAINSLKQDNLLASLVNREYEGTLQNEGDTVRVSEVNVPTATMTDSSTGDNTFQSSKVSTSYIDIKASKTITASYELVSLAQLESQIKTENSAIRESLIQSVGNKLNDYLYSLVSPSTSSPDHSIASVTDFNAARLASNRLLASSARWPKDGQWYTVLDPSYYSDFLNATTMTSSDYSGDRPLIAGQFVERRYGFNVLEDNSDGLLSLSPASTGVDVGLSFHRNFMHLVMPQEVTWTLSNLHANKQHGYLLSAHIVCGAALGVNGSKKHILVYNT